MVEALVAWTAMIWNELALFSGFGMVLLGVDDAVVDIVWFWRWAVHRLRSRESHTDDHSKVSTAPIAIFVATWQEADVIASMLRYASRQWCGEDYRIFVGYYQNDPDTYRAIKTVNNALITAVRVDHDGPTTKADCLNSIWSAMQSKEADCGERFLGVVLHDAEDAVHAAELRLYREQLRDYAVVQIPVFPSVDRNSLWVSGHYIDEFAEAHARDMVVRDWLGASLPLAGVGCAIRREAIAHLATVRDGKPFDQASLTEDYELGLVLGELGYRSNFCRVPSAINRLPIAVHAHFPDSLTTAIRQKSRWSVGIALMGWKKLGWRGGPAERWMRLRDRRSIAAAIILTTAYTSGLVYMLLLTMGFAFGTSLPAPSRALQLLISLCVPLLIWRAALRAAFVGWHYGALQAALSVPRMMVSSFVSIAAARNAVLNYVKYLKTGHVRWDKTQHVFPQRFRS